jgi:hypothetical protein
MATEDGDSLTMMSPSDDTFFKAAKNLNPNMKSDTNNAEESGTFEMGYITFFPKNNNENFQTIPEHDSTEQKPSD